MRYLRLCLRAYFLDERERLCLRRLPPPICVFTALGLPLPPVTEYNPAPLKAAGLPPTAPNAVFPAFDTAPVGSVVKAPP